MNKVLISIVIPTYNRRDKLTNLIESIYKNKLQKNKYEIIVVDDMSNYDAVKYIKKKFPDVLVLVNNQKKFLSGSRNAGLKYARGEFVFFIDDDNIIDPNALVEIYSEFQKPNNKRIAVIGPVTCYLNEPNLVLGAGVKRNMVTSITKFIGHNSNIQNLSESYVVQDIPNAFMVRKLIFEKVGYFDDKNFPFHYDEADFGERVRRKGYKLITIKNAIVFHDSPPPTEPNHDERIFPDINRTYYYSKNRIVFHKKYSKSYEFLVFFLIFLNLIFFYYVFYIIKSTNLRNKGKLLINYIKGTWDGLKVV